MHSATVGGRRLSCPLFLLLMAVLILSPVASAEPTACINYCFSTMFPVPENNTLCDMVNITLTVSTQTSYVYGGDIFSSSTNVQNAANFLGLAASGTEITLYMFFAGMRSFYPAIRKGTLNSGYLVSPQYGFILSMTPVCPAFSATAIPVTGLTGYAAGGGVGTQFYSSTSNAGFAAVHYGFLDDGETSANTLYLHQIESRVPLLRSRMNGVQSSYLLTPSPCYYLSTSIDSSEVFENVTRFVFDYDWTMTTPTFYGTTVYKADALIDVAAVHARLAALGQKQVVVYAHYVGERELYFRSYQNGITSSSRVDSTATASVLLSRLASPQPYLPPTITPITITVEQIVGPSIQGTTMYGCGSDVAAAAFHRGLLSLGESASLFVHDIYD